LFDRLYRVDKARGRSHGGSGLGLAICKSIAERFEGGIEAANVKPSGLRISVLFPVIPAGSATSRIGSGEDPN
ncbi:MAG: ATP-binding protein, partial [Syntrophobacteraceae bacterium]